MIEWRCPGCGDELSAETAPTEGDEHCVYCRVKAPCGVCGAPAETWCKGRPNMAGNRLALVCNDDDRRATRKALPSVPVGQLALFEVTP